MLFLIGGLVLLGCTGCVRSQASIFEAQLSSRVRPSAKHDPVVAMAFDLKGRSEPVTVIAAANE